MKKNWPFPPRTGPVPATPKQMRDWERRQQRRDLDRLPAAPF